MQCSVFAVNTIKELYELAYVEFSSLTQLQIGYVEQKFFIVILM